MIPFCTDTVTHYHYTGRDTWQRSVLRGVHWRYGTTSSAARTSDGRIERVPQTRIIIPQSLMPDIPIDTGGVDILGRIYGPSKFNGAPKRDSQWFERMKTEGGAERHG